MRQHLAALATILALIAAEAAGAVDGRWMGVERVVAVGDIHGAYDELVSIMQGTGVIDQDLHWSGGKTHFVSVGDIPDRGARSRDVIELFMRLQGEAEAAGGRLHVLLGNHDVMNMTGDLRYVSVAEYATFAADEPAGLRASMRARWAGSAGVPPEQASDSAEPAVAAPAEFDTVYPPGFFGHLEYYAPEGRFGRWLLERPLAIVINDTLFVHGGLSSALGGKGLAAINADVALVRDFADAWQRLLRAGIINPAMANALRAKAVRDALPSMTDPALGAAARRYLELDDALVLNSNSTTWYRGTAYCNELAELPTTQAVLDAVGARRVAFGHTPTRDSVITSRMNGRVLMIDTGMLRAVYKGRPSALVIDNGVARAWYADTAQFAAIAPAPRRVAPRPDRLTDDQVAAILREGEIVEVEDIGSGISRPQRITLRAGDITVRAAFVTIDESAGGWIEVAGERLKGPADRYRYNLAAYALDRMLGLNMVPVTVERRIDGRRGSLQLWVENAINERQRVEQGAHAGGWCSLEDQYNLTYAWDALIFNLDRTQENILYTPRDWMVWLIDHTRAFSANDGRPPLLRDKILPLSADLEAALRGLTRKGLTDALGDWLSRAQIKALLKRRDRLLRDWERAQG